MSTQTYKEFLSTNLFNFSTDLAKKNHLFFFKYFIEIMKLNERSFEADNFILEYLKDSLCLASCSVDVETQNNIIDLIREHYKSLGYNLPTTCTYDGLIIDMTLSNYMSMLVKMKVEDFPDSWKICTDQLSIIK